MTWACPKCNRKYPDSGPGVPSDADADSKLGCKQCIGSKASVISTLSVSTDAVEAPELWEAFVAGFMQSGEGHNAEYPHSFDKEQVKESIRDDFKEWMESELSE